MALENIVVWDGRLNRGALLLVVTLGSGFWLQAQLPRFDLTEAYRPGQAATPPGDSAGSYRWPQPVLVPNPFSNASLGSPATAVQSASNRPAGEYGAWRAPLKTPGLAAFPASLAPRIPPSSQPDEAAERQVSWKLIIPNFLSDQKHIWLFPVSLAEGRHWAPTLAVVGTTAGLVALDPHTAPYFRNTGKFEEFDDIFKVTTTERVFLGLPVVWYLGGLAARNNYAQQTGFFAAEALADVDLLAGVMRSVDGRLHPRDIPLPQNGGDYTHTWFKAKGTYLNRGGFPSGHTAGAFAVATIFSERYKRSHHWVPYVAYPLAALVGVSRITDSAHFPSDVFMGGALAYTIARYVVLREH